MRIRSGIAAFVAVFQAVVLLGHAFIYETWVYGLRAAGKSGGRALAAAVLLLGVSFVAASLLAFRYNNAPLRAFYRLSAVWLGLANFLFLAACTAWAILGLAWVARVHVDPAAVIGIVTAIGGAIGIFGVVNAAWTRVRRVTVRLAGLPRHWHGRSAALVSDLHLGHVRHRRFARKIVAMVNREKPEAVFVAGDLYDGTAIDAEHAAQPLSAFSAKHGAFFVAGNHEQFGDDSQYLRAVAKAGIRVLRNEKVEIDGLQVIGVPYRDATHEGHLRGVLRQAGVDRGRASVLLTHAPDRPGVAAEEGISLQISGHTHLGQFFPWTWAARRIYRDFAYGLSRLGPMQVYTSSGAGTWGPPLRVGSRPEIVILKLESA
jgi:uncharacterized protein